MFWPAVHCAVHPSRNKNEPGKLSLSFVRIFLTPNNPGPVHYSIVVDALFLALFVGVCGSVHDRRRLWFLGERELWRALRFLNIPRQASNVLAAPAAPAAPAGPRSPAARRPLYAVRCTAAPLPLLLRCPQPAARCLILRMPSVRIDVPRFGWSRCLLGRVACLVRVYSGQTLVAKKVRTWLVVCVRAVGRRCCTTCWRPRGWLSRALFALNWLVQGLIHPHPPRPPSDVNILMPSLFLCTSLYTRTICSHKRMSTFVFTFAIFNSSTFCDPRAFSCQAVTRPHRHILPSRPWVPHRPTRRAFAPTGDVNSTLRTAPPPPHPGDRSRSRHRRWRRTSDGERACWPTSARRGR